MTRLIWNGANFVPPEQIVRDRGPRGDFPTPLLALDTMNPVQSMLDGKRYDSKSALRATYKAAGVTEVGNDTAPMWKNPERPKQTEAIREAVTRAASHTGLI